MTQNEKNADLTYLKLIFAVLQPGLKRPGWSKKYFLKQCWMQNPI